MIQSILMNFQKTKFDTVRHLALFGKPSAEQGLIKECLQWGSFKRIKKSKTQTTYLPGIPSSDFMTLKSVRYPTVGLLIVSHQCLVLRISSLSASYCRRDGTGAVRRWVSAIDFVADLLVWLMSGPKRRVLSTVSVWSGALCFRCFSSTELWYAPILSRECSTNNILVGIP